MRGRNGVGVLAAPGRRLQGCAPPQAGIERRTRTGAVLRTRHVSGRCYARRTMLAHV